MCGTFWALPICTNCLHADSLWYSSLCYAPADIFISEFPLPHPISYHQILDCFWGEIAVNQIGFPTHNKKWRAYNILFKKQMQNLRKNVKSTNNLKKTLQIVEKPYRILGIFLLLLDIFWIFQKLVCVFFMVREIVKHGEGFPIDHESVN